MYNKGSASSLSVNAISANTATSTTAAASTTSAINSNGGGGAGATDRIEWSRATILGFIEDYRRQRVLWDPNTKGYHIKQTKYEALKSLGQKYGAEIRSIRSKIKSLRSSFHREHGKVINGRRKGQNYQPMWFAYDAIRFILDGETGDSDEADQKTEIIDGLDEGRNSHSNANLNNNNNNNGAVSPLSWGCPQTKVELLELERKINSRDFEHFNNHFMALGLQARHPLTMLAAVEAAAAASALSLAQEKRHEQDFALKRELLQQHLDKDDKLHDAPSPDAPRSLKVIELTSNNTACAANANNNNNNTHNGNGSSHIGGCSDNANPNASASSCSTVAALNPVSKPFASPKPSSPLTVVPTTTTATTPPPPPPPSSEQSGLPPQPPQPPSQTSSSSASTTSQSQSQPQPSSTTTCSPEGFNVLHGSRSLDENSAAIGNATVATAIPSLPIIAAVSRTSDFDSSEYCNISAEDVKTEIFENDSNELNLLDRARTSTPVPLNYHKSAGDLTMQRSDPNGSGGGGGGSGRKRKATSDANSYSPSKLMQQHSSALFPRLRDEGADFAGTSYRSGPHELGALANGNEGSAGGSKTGGGGGGSGGVVDEYDIFGEYVAITIRKLKASKAKIVVKHLINNLLYEAELGKYDQGIPSCKEPPELYKT